MSTEDAELIPCPFCGGGEFRFNNMSHWTGQREVIIAVTLRHWCDSSEPWQPMFSVTRATALQCAAVWNKRHD